MAIFHEIAVILKKIFLFHPKGQISYKIQIKYETYYAKKPPESIGASFVKISRLEPEKLQL